MTNEIYSGPEMTVTRFVGPESEGLDRQRWQFTPVGWSYTFGTLNRREVIRLAEALLEDARDGPGGTARLASESVAARRG